jgi:ribosome-associated translation inhibitor RaiA
VVRALQGLLRKEANVQLPLQITYRDMEPTPGMDAAIRDKVDHLQRYHPRIVRCHVVVDAPHSSQHHPHHFRVMFNITIPGKEIVAAKENHDKPEQRDFYISLRDSYEAARRQLEAEREKAQGHTKVHEVPPHGRVSKLFPGQDYGFVFMPDGNEVYFHRNAVVEGSWEDIEVGDEVRRHERPAYLVHVGGGTRVVTPQARPDPPLAALPHVAIQVRQGCLHIRIRRGDQAVGVEHI